MLLLKYTRALSYFFVDFKCKQLIETPYSFNEKRLRFQTVSGCFLENVFLPKGYSTKENEKKLVFLEQLEHLKQSNPTRIIAFCSLKALV